MRRVTSIAAALLAGALALTACGGSDGDTATNTTPSGSATAKSIKVGVAYDIGGRGDQSFNDAAAKGLDQAKSELGVTGQEAEAKLSEPESAKEERLRLLAQNGFNPVIGIGFAYASSLAKVAKEFPKTTFAIIDNLDAKGANITNLVFAEEQGSFLVGAAAALKTKTGTVGFIGGCTVDLIKKFEAGYKAGVEAAKPGTKVLSKYLSDPPGCEAFRTTDTGKTAGQGMYDQGADIVFHAAGASGIGLFEAAKASNKLAIGVDQDQYNTADPKVKDIILTSMIKRVDVATFEFIKNFQDGTVKSGPVLFDLKSDGVGYATSGGKIDDIKAQIDGYKAKIISGEIKVPVTP